MSTSVLSVCSRARTLRRPSLISLPASERSAPLMETAPDSLFLVPPNRANQRQLTFSQSAFNRLSLSYWRNVKSLSTQLSQRTEWTATLKVIPTKMLLPNIRSRIEQSRLPSRRRIDNLDPIRLLEIAPNTGPGQIIERGRSATRSGNHVLDVKVAPCSDWSMRQYSHRPAARAATTRSISREVVIPAYARANGRPRLAPAKAIR